MALLSLGSACREKKKKKKKTAAAAAAAMAQASGDHGRHTGIAAEADDGRGADAAERQPGVEQAEPEGHHGF